MKNFVFVVIATCLAAGWGAHPAEGQTPPAAPTGTVAFFNLNSCPSGWTSPALLQGQLILAVTDGSHSGDTNGESPLSNQEDRAHDHCYLTTVHLGSKSISGGSGCCNNQGAKKGDYPVSGVTDEGATELPFTQLGVCEKE